MSFTKNKNKTLDSTPKKEKANAPVFKQKVGTVEASVWENQTEEGSFLTVSTQRNYLVQEDGKDVWKVTNSLRVNDIPAMILALQECYKFAKVKTKHEDEE